MMVGILMMDCEDGAEGKRMRGDASDERWWRWMWVVEEDRKQNRGRGFCYRR